jgi:hypothetical protein
MNKLRKRLVNFRVTEQEFERIKIASDRQGARCISEFARSLMLGDLGSDSPSDFRDSLNDMLLSHDCRLAILENQVARLTEAIFDSTSNPIPFPKMLNGTSDKPR